MKIVDKTGRASYPQGRKGGIGSMCYNCGCGLADDDMGQGNAGVDNGGKSITNKTFEVAAESQGMSADEAKRQTFKLLKEELGEK